MAKLTKSTYAQLLELAKQGINTLLTGAHGIGKTTLFHALCADLGMKGAYVNVPSADYFVDWLGIPAPEQEPPDVQMIRWMVDHQGLQYAHHYAAHRLGLGPDFVNFVASQRREHRLEFLRPKRLEGVNFVFFDEINREADPRFTDSCMEMVQFRRLNGEAMPDLKLVWAAQNPPNSIYKVKELDVPLIDKFGAHIYLEGRPDRDWFLQRGYDPHIVESVLSWYEADLNKDQREKLSPRSVENVMRLVSVGVDVDFAMLSTMGIPAHLLKAKLARSSTSHQYSNLDLATIAANPMQYTDPASSDIDFCAFYTDLLRNPRANATTMLKTIPVFLAMGFEWQSKCCTDQPWLQRMLAETVGSAMKPPMEITSVPGYAQFVELLKQFKTS